MPKEEKKVKGKIQLVPNVLYPGQSRFAYKTNDGSIFVISFKLKNVVSNTITYIVRLFLLISEKETQFIKEFSFDSSHVSNNKINRLLRQISNKNFKKCPDNYEEFNNEVSKEIIAYILNNNNKSLKSDPPSDPYVSLVPTSSYNMGPQEGLTITIDNITYYTLTNPTTKAIEASVIGNTLTSLTDVTIPDTIEDSNTNSYNVTNIGYNSFKNSIYLTGITIPDSVTSIDQGPFRFCNALSIVTLPKNSSFNTIKDNTFLDCIALKEITIYNYVTNISSIAFEGCVVFKNSGILYTDSKPGDYVYDYFAPGNKNGFNVLIKPLLTNS